MNGRWKETNEKRETLEEGENEAKSWNGVMRQLGIIRC